MSLEGKLALVTGGSRGIGRSIACRLAASGADVVVNFVAHPDAAAEVVTHIQALGRRAFAAKADVSDEAQMNALFDRVAHEWGALDIYVNNAIDVAAFGPVVKFKTDAWRHTIDSHVTTFLIGAQRAAQLMAGRGGTIVALSSLGSRTCIPGYAAVGVGKAAVEALTRYLAAELASAGIRVNAVSAGPIETDALRFQPHFQTIVSQSKKVVPAGRIGVPADVSEVVAFLCDDGARWIFGQTIVADGGMSLLSGQLTRG
jgi:enoyl-[acyl-carrier protein] reductase III